MSPHPPASKIKQHKPTYKNKQPPKIITQTEFMITVNNKTLFKGASQGVQLMPLETLGKIEQRPGNDTVCLLTEQ